MLFISVGNGMRFFKVDALAPNFENTPSYDEKFASVSVNKCYKQKWQDDSVVAVQVGSNVATVPTIDVYQPEVNTASPITAVLITSYTTATNPSDYRYYFEFYVDFSNYTDKDIQVKVTQGSDVYLSEYQKGLDLDDDIANGSIRLIVNTNAAQPTDYTNFQIDYTTGISFFFYVEAILMDYSPQVEDEVLDNIDSKILLESSIYRGLVLKTEYIPRFMIEKIVVAAGHFYFLVSNLQQIASGGPSVEMVNNWGTLEWLLIQKDTIGFNTDNIGDKKMMTLSIRNFTADTTIVVPAGYFVHFFACNHESGSAGAYTLKAGYSVGTDELFGVFGNTVAAPVLAENHMALVHKQKSFNTATTIYITYVSGTGTGKIGIQISKNVLA